MAKEDWVIFQQQSLPNRQMSRQVANCVSRPEGIGDLHRRSKSQPFTTQDIEGSHSDKTRRSPVPGPMFKMLQRAHTTTKRA